MTGQPDESWTGARLGPLPYESTLSALWRFGYLNGLRGSALCQTCFNRPTLSHNSVLLRSDLTKFREATNWSLPNPVEVECFNFACDTLGTWFHNALRFCPVCLESGFHSIWHQFTPLHVCPLHGCMLTKVCQSCGCETTACGNQAQLFFQPYICPSCREPLAGVDQSMSAHLEFRVHASQVADAFADLDRWLLDAKRHLAPLRNVAEQRSWMTLNGSLKWCKPNTLIRGVAMQLLPFPPVQRRPNPGICLLRWHVVMQTLDRLPGQGRVTWRRRVQTPTAVFRATVRMLQRWLFGNPSAQDRENRLHTMWSKAQEEGAVDVQAWNPYELAYVLMRDSQGDVSNLGAGASHVTIADAPAVGLRTYEGRAPRLAYRGVYLAIYAGYFHLVTRARCAGIVEVQSLRRLPLSRLTAVFNLPQNAVSVVSGGAFFPSVPGMPIRPFSAIIGKGAKSAHRGSHCV